MNKPSRIAQRIAYYLRSIPIIIGQIENWYSIPLLFMDRKVIIRLRNGCRFRVRSLMDVWIIKETCLDRQYEAYGAPIQDGWTVIDVGAGLGDFSILVAREHPHARVYAYEPFPESYHLLQENISINQVNNVLAFKMAVGDKKEKVRLFLKGEAVQHTTTVMGPSKNPYTEVQSLRLEDILVDNKIEYCDFLKMDCEGCEFSVLLNTPHYILERISRICLEYHEGFTPYTLADLIQYLHRHGFRTRVTPNPVHAYLGFLYADRS